jgi:hypothetical protein
MDLTFPLYDKRRQPPVLAEACAICGADFTKIPLTVVLTAGALLRLSETCALPDERMEGFLRISHHEVFPDVVRGERDRYGRIPVVEDANSGQFDLGFCSVACLREFFATLCDRVEAGIEQCREERNREAES